MGKLKRSDLFKLILLIGLVALMFLGIYRHSANKSKVAWGYTSVSRVDDTTVTFSMLKGLNNSELINLDGKDVVFYGYISPDHFLRGKENKVIFITYNPEGVCSLHTYIENTETTDLDSGIASSEDSNTFLENTIAVELKEPKILGLEPVPFKITGKLSVESLEDEYGHKLDYKIKDAELAVVSGEKTTGILKNYIELTSVDVFSTIREEINKIDLAFGSDYFNLGVESLELVNKEKLEGVKQILEERNKNDDLLEALEVVNEVIALSDLVNNSIVSGDLTPLKDPDKIKSTMLLFEKYRHWQLKYSL